MCHVERRDGGAACRFREVEPTTLFTRPGKPGDGRRDGNHNQWLITAVFDFRSKTLLEYGDYPPENY